MSTLKPAQKSIVSDGGSASLARVFVVAKLHLNVKLKKNIIHVRVLLKTILDNLCVKKRTVLNFMLIVSNERLMQAG